MSRAVRVRESIRSDWEFCICGAALGFSWYNVPAEKIDYSKPPDFKYMYCVECFKPSHAFMNECDTCNKLFKGGLPKAKFAFTCPDCEARL